MGAMGGLKVTSGERDGLRQPASSTLGEVVAISAGIVAVAGLSHAPNSASCTTAVIEDDGDVAAARRVGDFVDLVPVMTMPDNCIGGGDDDRGVGGRGGGRG